LNGWFAGIIVGIREKFNRPPVTGNSNEEKASPA
jgi:hypothetical protein